MKGRSFLREGVLFAMIAAGLGSFSACLGVRQRSPEGPQECGVFVPLEIARVRKARLQDGTFWYCRYLNFEGEMEWIE